ncbi:MAG: hypothetical protein JEZ10_09120 [Verrucomicrobia bacterium]|nr:hypothetical protein [Verrucomicrobiota bacterium]
MRNEQLEQQMRIIMDVVVMGRQLRKDNNSKVRQPLRRLDVVSRDSELLNQVDELKEIIAEELNVRDVVFGDDENGLAVLSAKANFKTLGPKFGKDVQLINTGLQKLVAAELRRFEAGSTIKLASGGKTFEVSVDDILIERTPREGLAVQTQGALVVALDLELDDDLICEGLARELIKEVQQLRKAMAFEVTDRIHLKISSDEIVREAVSAFDDYIRAEVLATAVKTVETNGETVDLNGHACTIFIEKA